MANIGDKFIITIGDKAENEQSGETLYRIKGFKSLVFDENGIEKLEKYEGHNVEVARRRQEMSRVEENKNMLKSLDRSVHGDAEHCIVNFMGIQTSIMIDISKSLAEIADRLEKKNEE